MTQKTEVVNDVSTTPGCAYHSVRRVEKMRSSVLENSTVEASGF
jgi:hypothetical protein